VRRSSRKARRRASDVEEEDDGNRTLANTREKNRLAQRRFREKQKATISEQKDKLDHMARQVRPQCMHARMPHGHVHAHACACMFGHALPPHAQLACTACLCMHACRRAGRSRQRAAHGRL
jgi:hypothetical protein